MKQLGGGWGVEIQNHLPEEISFTFSIWKEQIEITLGS